MLTVKQLARLAGITPRTLHYYDEIGLLKPSRVGANGYRYYGDDALLRLQQILLYRELEMPLEGIREMLERPDFDVPAALERHQAELRRRIQRLERILGTVNTTIDHLKGKTTMNNDQLFTGFSEEQQAEYAKEAELKYDPETVRASNRKWKNYTPAQKQAILAEGGEVYTAFLKAMPAGAGSPEAQACVEHWRRHMDYFWTPTLDQLTGLADLYNEDARFKANYDRLDPGLAEFVRAAVKIYVSSRR
jgi:DNA-binding transcriptional MerR regulator